jgi:3-hydroxyisobutyrate dehydrogenase-like beta-hydroxyacid dehydrogenase
MVGGAADSYDRVLPYLQQMGQRILRVGPSGQGQTLKLVSNMVSALNLMAAAEGLQLGRHLGLSVENMASVMNFGSAQSYELTKVLDRFTASDFRPGFSVANRLKDLRLAVEMARENDFSPDLAGFALPLYDSHSRSGYREQDEASYVLKWDAGKGEDES